MEQTDFINGLGSKSTDFEKLFFYIYYDSIRKFVSKSKRLVNWMIVFITLFLIGLLLTIFNYESELFGWGIFLLAFSGTGFFITFYKYIKSRISTTMDKIGLVNIPFLHHKLQDKSVLIDQSTITPHASFEFPSLDPRQIKQLSQELSSVTHLIEHYPAIISHNKKKIIPKTTEGLQKNDLKIYTEEISLVESAKSIGDTVNAAQTQTVSMPVVKKDRELLKHLKFHAYTNHVFKLENYPGSKIMDNIQQIDGIVDAYSGDQDIDQICSKLLHQFHGILPRYTYSLNRSLHDIMNKYHMIMNYQLFNIAHNNYCPYCNKEAYQQMMLGDYTHNGEDDGGRVSFKNNTKMMLSDGFSQTWKCPLCEKETQQPIQKHKLDDELFTPVYDKLYEEHFKDRLSIYNNINDQKRKYAEKASAQFHQVLRENRTKEDHIKSKIRNISAEIDSEQEAINQLNDLLVKYERIDKDRAKEIDRDIKKIKKDVEKENKKAKEEINKTVKQAKSKVESSTKKYAKLEREDQKQRDKIQEQMAKDIKKIKDKMGNQDDDDDEEEDED